MRRSRGYPRYLGERYGHLYRALPGRLRRSRDRAARRSPPAQRAAEARRALARAEDDRRSQPSHPLRWWTIGDKAALLARSSRAQGTRRLRLEADVAHLGGLDAMMYVDARTSLADNLLLYGDKMSMAVSLEARVPFLDLELMRLAESMPATLQDQRADAEAYPEAGDRAVGTRRGDRSEEDRLRHSGRRLASRCPSSGSRGAPPRRKVPPCRSFFDTTAIRRTIEEHASGRHDHKRILFSLLTFEIWHEQFIAPSRWSG